MKKRLLYYLFLLTIIWSFSPSIFAQQGNINIKATEIFKGTGHNFSDVFMFAKEDGEGGFVTFRSYAKGLTFNIDGFLIDHYNSDLKLLKSTELKINGKTQNLLHAEVKNGMVNIIALEQQDNSKRYNYNLISGELKSFNFKRKKLYSFDRPELPETIEKKQKKVLIWSHGKIYFSDNNDFSAILLDISSKEKEEYKIIVFNNSYELIHDFTFEKGIKDDLFKFEDLIVNNTNGSIYLLGKVFENNKAKDELKGKVNYHFELFHISDKDKKEVSISTESKFISNIEDISLNNEDLSMIAFYADDKPSSKLKSISGNPYAFKGIARINLDSKSLEIKKKSFVPFPENLLIQKFGKKRKSKENEIKFLVPIGSYKSKNGHIRICMEEFIYGTYGDFKKDIVVLDINNKGEIIWSKVIKKEQFGAIVTPGGSRFIPPHYKNMNVYPIGNLISKMGSRAFFTNDNTYLFLNAEKIKDLKDDQIQFVQKKTKTHELYVVKIGTNGKTEHKKILKKEESETTIQTGWGSLINDNEIIFYAGDKNFGGLKKRRQFYKLTLN